MPPLVLAAHGTRSATGVSLLERLADRVRSARPGTDVRLGFLEIASPSLASVSPPACVVVPLLLSGGYHRFVDLPAIAPDVPIARVLGPDPLLTSVLVSRMPPLTAGDAVVLGAAGSSDPAALADVRAAARLLAVRLARPVIAGFASAGSPTVAEAVRLARRNGARRVVVVSYLLAPGHFHLVLGRSGADVVTRPLGVHDKVVELIWRRYESATPAMLESLLTRRGRRE